MLTYELNLIAIRIRKWDLEHQKITIDSFFILNNEEKNISYDVTLLDPAEMVEEFMGKLRFEFGKTIKNGHPEEAEEIEIEVDSEAFVRQKLHAYFKRIQFELNNPRRKKGQTRMIYSTHMDVYGENQDISFLPRIIQFFVLLNWARKYYEKEEYGKAIDPLKKLLRINPQFGLGYKWLARCLKKNRKYEEAMRFYEKYAEVDGSTDSFLDLAKSYRKGKLFDRSEEIYQQILQNEPDNKEARISLAQIRYAQKEDGYMEILDELHKEDPEWLKSWLIEEFNFRIYVSEKTFLTPVQASKFLGYGKVFELTQRAFKNDLPSHFNPAKARLSFYKEELENWAKVMNRYQCYPEEIKLYPEKIENELSEYSGEPEIVENEIPAENTTPVNSEGRSLTKVEQIILEIRQRKAKRIEEQARREGRVESKPSVNPEPKADDKPKGRRKKSETDQSSPAESGAKTGAGNNKSPEAPKKGGRKKSTGIENTDDNNNAETSASGENSQNGVKAEEKKKGRPKKKHSEETVSNSSGDK